MPPRDPLRPSRRQFLVSSGAALTAAYMASFGSSCLLAADEPAKKLGIAFVGIGGFCKGELLPASVRSKWCKPVALVTGHPDKNRAVADQYGIDPKNIYTYDNYDTIKNNPDIDAVYIVLPNGMHAEYTVRAFAAGKHVMCEKPMANTTQECQQMIDAGKAAGKRLQIGYRMHWDSPTLACIAALRDGRIGPIQMIDAAQGFTIGAPQWRLDKKLAGGGPVMDVGIYAFSAARYFTGENPTEVFANIFTDPANLKFREVEQNCNFQLKFPSGVLASCMTSYNTNLGRFTVFGPRGHAVMEPSSSYRGCKFSLNGQPQNVPEADQIVGELDGFAMAIAGAGPSKATGEEGLLDMRIIEGIYESARTGLVVKL